jgi:hypothetical protein
MQRQRGRGISWNAGFRCPVKRLRKWREPDLILGDRTTVTQRGCQWLSVIVWLRGVDTP